MKPAALGIRVHSGWGALVAITANPGGILLLERKRISVIDPNMEGASQPYHFVEEQPLSKAEEHIAECSAVSERLAFAALRDIVAALRRRGYEVAGCAVLLAAGRPLPELPQILASHALIHTAEGVFFREIFSRAARRLKIPVQGVKERDLQPSLEIADMGKIVGPPWTADQKRAAAAARALLR